MQSLIKLLSLGLLTLIGALIFSWELTDHTLLIESRESKGPAGHAVFNQIKFQSFEKKDIWKMKQSFNGTQDNKKNQWDELKIIVDKSKNPYEVQYFQLKKGKEIEYKVPCMICHVDGPRVIRPKFKSTKAKLKWRDYMTLFSWNLRIKNYGKVKTIFKKLPGGRVRSIPLEFDTLNAQRKLSLKTCNYCHGDNSFLGRSGLKKQNALTIKYLTDQKIMPPWPFSLNEKEKKSLKQFLSSK